MLPQVARSVYAGASRIASDTFMGRHRDGMAALRVVEGGRDQSVKIGQSISFPSVNLETRSCRTPFR